MVFQDEYGITPNHDNASRFLPFALRLLITFLPCLVDILFKKPCVLARFFRLGW
jgi:hypothetical protein